MSIRPIGVAFAWPIISKHDVIHKTGSTYRIALLSEQDRVTATGTEQFDRFGRVVFEISERTDRHTDIQTDIQTRSSQYFAPLSGVK